MAKYLSSYFVVRYFHLFIFSPYFLYLGYKLYQNFNNNTQLSPNNPKTFVFHSYILMFLGIFAGIYNYKLLFDNSNLFISLFFLLSYLVILAVIYKVKILNEELNKNMLKKSIFNL